MNLRISTLLACLAFTATQALAARPNILIAIADDQSYPHASAYGDPAIRTPGFDRVARNGVLFRICLHARSGMQPDAGRLFDGTRNLAAS